MTACVLCPIPAERMLELFRLGIDDFDFVQIIESVIISSVKFIMRRISCLGTCLCSGMVNKEVRVIGSE